MENSNKMKKNILIFIIVIFALIAVLSIIFTKWQEPYSGPSSAVKVNTVALDKNISELNSFDADLVLFVQDGNNLNEMDSILDEVGEINGASSSLTKDEQDLNNFNSDLAGLSGDKTIDKEIDQLLQEVSL